MTDSVQVQELAKVKGKTKAKLEIVDLIQDTATLIENLSKEKALAMADGLVEEDDFGAFKLGGLFSVIQDKGWYEGFATFGEFIQDRYNKSYRVGMYYINIYNSLVNSQVAWDDVKTLGWTKLRILTGILTKENSAEWIQKAAALTCKQLAEAVKTAQQQGGDAGEGTSNTVTSTISNLTFKVHEDQKVTIREALDKAKAESFTEFDTVALDNICTAYLGGTVTIDVAEQANASLLDVFAKHTYQEIIEAFGVAFPEINITVEI